VNRTFLASALAVAIAGLPLISPHNAKAAGAGATPTPAAAKSTNASKSAKKKDPCATAKSKWAHAQCEQYNSSAPGDEYFGRMKISYLGINNTYKDGAISAGDFTTDPKLVSKLDFATEALKKWAGKYPGDPQLPRSYFLGVQVLRKVYTQPEQQTTWQFIQILVHKYGNTYFGKITKASIAHGYTEHWFAVAQPCPTPPPAPPSPGRGVKVQNTPSEAPTASPTPAPTAAPGQMVVNILTPPCVPPAPAVDESSPAAPSTNASPSAKPN
jgi:hypothetical protein